MEKMMYKKIFVLIGTGFLFMLFIVSVAGKSKEPTNHAQVAIIPKSSLISKKDIPYGSDPLQKLDVQYSTAFRDAPIMVMVHGGGWIAGDKSDAKWRDFVDFFYKQGLVVANINYRLSTQDGKNTFPIPVNDAACAVAWIKKNAGLYGADPSKVMLFGHSAGAHLAAMIHYNPEGNWLRDCGIKDQSLKILGHIGSSGVYDLNLINPNRWQVGCFLMSLLNLSSCGEKNSSWSQIATANQNVVAPANPITFVDGNDPKAQLFAGEWDCFLNRPEPGTTNRCIKQITIMEAKLKNVGAPYEAYILSGYNHGGFIDNFFTNTDLQNKVAVFIKSITGAKTTPPPSSIQPPPLPIPQTGPQCFLCGKGYLNICDDRECRSLGDCRYTNYLWFWWGKCATLVQ